MKLHGGGENGRRNGAQEGKGGKQCWLVGPRIIGLTADKGSFCALGLGFCSEKQDFNVGFVVGSAKEKTRLMEANRG